MDSLKMFKGYGKVVEDNNNHLEDQQQQQQKPPHHKFSKSLIIATVSIFAILFLILTLATQIHHTNNTHTDSPNSATTPSSIIKAICNVTRYPDSCISSISSSPFSQPPTDPEAILNISLRVSLKELTNLSSSLNTFMDDQGPAFADCKDQINDAVSQLNDSVSALSDGKVLSEGKIRDIQTWVSAAATDQQTCLDGLEEMGSSVVDQVKRKLQRSSEYISNSLAIVAHMRILLDQFNVPLH
ncbi:hypothetical protein RIF29_09945 [Crotalaria pallida]|uniref:pectinesterase n=1 Tax=Crotalaria pallida TaxID=3830 RepID=A0AAN9FSA1_CROPI